MNVAFYLSISMELYYYMMPSLTLDIITTLKNHTCSQCIKALDTEYGDSRVVPTTNRYHILIALDVL
jgi:hypothetical protein